MKYLLFSLLLVITLLNADRCDKVEEQADGTVSLGEVFEIELEQSIKLKGESLGLRFAKLAESRCPINTNCIRPGEAIATLELITESGTNSYTFEVEAYCQKDDGSCGQVRAVSGYQLKLLNVYPYPNSEDKGAKRVKMVVEKI